MRVIEHAFRRCRIPAQKLTPEMISTATETLSLFMAALVARGIQLWLVERILVQAPLNQAAVPMPAGTVDVLSVMSRDYTSVSFTGSVVSSTTYQMTPTASSNVSMVAVTFSTTVTTALTVSSSSDGVSFTTSLSIPSTAYTAGATYWFELDPVVTAPYFRVVGASAISVSSAILANNGTDIELAAVSRDDYENMPNKTFSGRPLQFYMDRQRDQSVLRLWPVANATWAAKPLAITRRREMMDVGTLQQNIDVPKRWYDAIVWQLAWRVAKETPEVDAAIIPDLKMDAADALAMAQAGEADRSPMRIAPRIGAYTR
jgi:hypothetical protein